MYIICENCVIIVDWGGFVFIEIFDSVAASVENMRYPFCVLVLICN